MSTPSRAITSARSRRSRRCRPTRRGRGARAFSPGCRSCNLKKLRRRVRDVQGAGGRRADARPCSTTSASCSCAAAARRRPAQPTFYFNKAAEADPDDPDYFFNLGYAYLARSRSAGGDLLAARSGPAQSGGRRRAFRARRRARRRRQRRRRRRASGAGAAAVVDVRSRDKRPAADAVPEGSSGSRTTSSCRTPAASTRGWRRAEQREQEELAHVLSRSRPPVVSAGERSRGGRRVESRAVSLAVPRRRAPAARPHPPAERPRARGDRRVQDRRCGAPRPRRRTPRSARRTARRRISRRRVPKRSARWPSIRHRWRRKQLLDRVETRRDR